MFQEVSIDETFSLRILGNKIFVEAINIESECGCKKTVGSIICEFTFKGEIPFLMTTEITSLYKNFKALQISIPGQVHGIPIFDE